MCVKRHRRGYKGELYSHVFVSWVFLFGHHLGEKKASKTHWQDYWEHRFLPVTIFVTLRDFLTPVKDKSHRPSDTPGTSRGNTWYLAFPSIPWFLSGVHGRCGRVSPEKRPEGLLIWENIVLWHGQLRITKTGPNGRYSRVSKKSTERAQTQMRSKL